jgi:hypothetical protein
MCRQVITAHDGEKSTFTGTAKARSNCRQFYDLRTLQIDYCVHNNTLPTSIRSD